MTPLWRKPLYKVCDLVVTLPVGHLAWSGEMLEPLAIDCVCLIFLIARGSSDTLGVYWKWEGLCMECGTPSQSSLDLFLPTLDCALKT